MTIDPKAYNRKKMQKKQDAQTQALKSRIAKFGGVSSPTPKTVEKYIDALDDLLIEMRERYGDLGTGPYSAGGKIEKEKKAALALLARMQIDRVKPSSII